MGKSGFISFFGRKEYLVYFFPLFTARGYITDQRAIIDYQYSKKKFTIYKTVKKMPQNKNNFILSGSEIHRDHNTLNNNLEQTCSYALTRPRTNDILGRTNFSV